MGRGRIVGSLLINNPACIVLPVIGCLAFEGIFSVQADFQTLSYLEPNLLDKKVK